MAAILGFTQVNRALRIDTPLGPDKLLLRSLSAQETISQLFRFQLDLVSEDDSIKFDSIVGQPVTLQMEIADGERYWNGFISRFSQGPRDDRFTSYRAEMVPWLWFLTRTADCRIFQNKTVPDIVQQIFGDLGFSDYKLKLYKTYGTRDYCVQYRETDFNFVSRLMEEEGIYYFFQHEQGIHTLILADDAGAHQPCPGQPKARYDAGTGGWSPDDTIAELRLEQEFRPSAWAHTDYNFETPSTGLMVTVQDAPKFEIYDYPGTYSKRADGDKLAKMRLEETMAFRKRSSGKSKCRAFNAGYTVEVTDHYRADVNRKWLITAVYHQASMGGSYAGGAADEGTHYENTFECIPSDVPFRPPRTTPKPHVQGCQTAVVVGPAGEEIYTDKFGRVKVQFHWDREGARNENSSCWMRVSSPWAGKGWGGIQIPRIGQEVVVDFLEGDPDRPIVMGNMYHAENMPPWGLPAKAVISGFKSDSSKGGGGYNEFSMDDTKGNELIQVHAQFDQDIKVLHDERTNVGNDRTEEVKHDESVKIGNDRRESIMRDRYLVVERNKFEKVLGDKSINVVGNHNERIDGSMDLMVGSTLTESVAVNHSQAVGGAMEITVGGLIAISAGLALAEVVGAARTEAVGGSSSESVGGSKSLDITGNLTETVAGGRIVDITKDVKETVGGQHTATVTKEFALRAKKIELVADDEIAIKTGSARIVMTKNGDITIQGAKLNVKGSGDIIIKGSQIKGN